MVENRFDEPDLTAAVEKNIGPYRLALVYRTVRTDEGPTVHVFGPVNGDEEEILRFDCFREMPHYHLGFGYLEKPVISIEQSDPLAWVLSELSRRFDEYLELSEAGNELPEDWRNTSNVITQEFATTASNWSS
ncbi:MAG: hypothetical protein P8J55_02210 [Pseudomonadales bacterium]|nr:hypothetical protein [Pseudomonadales bacterium]